MLGWWSDSCNGRTSSSGSSLEAGSLLLGSFETGIVQSRMPPAVIAAWLNRKRMELQPRNGWSDLNASTGVLMYRQKSSPQEAALQTIQLQRLLNPPDVIDIDSTPGDCRLPRQAHRWAVPSVRND